MALSDWTAARVGLGLAGHACPTNPHLEMRLAQARARDAVHAPLEINSLASALAVNGWPSQILQTQARNRAEYLRRPDLGRLLSEESRELVGQLRGAWEITFILVDGLSARAIERHAPPLLEAVFAQETSKPDEAHPLWIVQQGRVAIGDEIGELLGAALTVVLVGERPGLSAPDSLGIYLTWGPRKGRTDADRNCISNIHAGGLSYGLAVHKLLFLMSEARTRKLSGVPLKETAPTLLEGYI